MSRRNGVRPPAQAIPVVRLTAQDVPDVLAIERECFTLPWSESQMRTAFVQPHFVAFGLGRMQLLGYVSLYHATDEVEIVNIAVLPMYRRQGYGARLLCHALRQMQKTGMQRAVLEVRAGNAAALALYARLGFVQTGLREAYYADTGEDALVFALNTAFIASFPRRQGFRLSKY